MTAAYEAALTMKQVDTPRVRIRTPPMAGPMTRAEFMTTLLRLTALGRRSRPTISETNVCRAGLSNRLTTPSSAERANTMPESDRVGDHEQAEGERQQPGRGLRGVEHLALVETVGDQPTEGTEKEQGEELEPGGDGDIDAGAVEAEEDEVGLGHHLHPGARDRDDLPGEVQAVVADRQGRERAVAGIGEAAHWPDQVFEEGHQLGRAGLLVGAQLGQAPGEEGVLQRADALQGAAARRA